MQLTWINRINPYENVRRLSSVPYPMSGVPDLQLTSEQPNIWPRDFAQAVYGPNNAWMWSSYMSRSCTTFHRKPGNFSHRFLVASGGASLELRDKVFCWIYPKLLCERLLSQALFQVLATVTSERGLKLLHKSNLISLLRMKQTGCNLFKVLEYVWVRKGCILLLRSSNHLWLKVAMIDRHALMTKSWRWSSWSLSWALKRCSTPASSLANRRTPALAACNWRVHFGCICCEERAFPILFTIFKLEKPHTHTHTETHYESLLLIQITTKHLEAPESLWR